MNVISDSAKALTARPKVTWWAIFAAILIAGFVLAATGYRHGLPAVDFGDEVTIWTMGRAYIDPSWTLYQPQQPPGILVVSGLVQQLQIALGDPYINVAVTIEIMRFMSVIAFVVMLALTMLLARRFAGPIAGIAAGLFLAPLPLATDLAKLSTSSVWTAAWLIAAVLAGIEGWTRRSLLWVAFSLLLAIIGTLFKWQDAAALGVAGLALLSLWRADKRRITIALLFYIVIVGVLSYWAVFVHHALEGEVYMPGVPTKPPTPDLILLNLFQMTTQVAPALFYAILPLIALILSALPRFRVRLHRDMGLWSLPCVILVYTIIISFNGAPVFSRHYLPIIPVLAVLAGVGIALLFQWLKSLNFKQPWLYPALGGLTAIAIIIPVVQMTVLIVLAGVGIALLFQWLIHFKQPWLYPALVGLAAIAIIIPIVQMTVQSYQNDVQDSLPDRRAALIEWARTTIDAPLMVTDNELAPILQPTYGYRGPTLVQPYNLDGSVQVKPEDVDQKVIDAQNIRYLVTSSGFKSDKLQLTPLLRYAPRNTRGNAWQVFYVGSLPPVLPQPAAVFGNKLALRGYNISKTSICQADAINIQMLWSPVDQPPRNYSTYVHLDNAQYGELSLGLDRPLGTERRPTTTWVYPTEVVVDPLETATITPEMRPGVYEVWLGVYDPLGNERLTLPDKSDHFVLGSLEIKQCVQASK